MNVEPETSSERVAIVVWYMAHGMNLSTQEVSRMTGLKMRGALALMYSISRVVPIYQEKDIWRICKRNGTHDAHDTITTESG